MKNHPQHPDESQLSGCSTFLMSVIVGAGLGLAYGYLYDNILYGTISGTIFGFWIAGMMSRQPKTKDPDKRRAELLKKYIFGIMFLLAAIGVFVYLYVEKY